MMKSAKLPPNHAEHFANSHLFTAHVGPLRWYTDILWRQEAASEDAAPVLPAVDVSCTVFFIFIFFTTSCLLFIDTICLMRIVQ